MSKDNKHTVYLEWGQLNRVMHYLDISDELESVEIKKVNDCYAVTTDYNEKIADMQYEARVAMFRNHYQCDCGEEWSDEWSAMCNDKCPECNSEIEPYESEDIEEPYVHE